jgi:predicted PurR-regulated permease PerM
MPDVAGDGRRRIHVSARSVVLVVAAIGLALVVRNVFERATRVMGWFAAAAVVAGLVYPVVEIVSRRIRRGLALLVVVLALVATVGGLVYAVIDDVRNELDHLQEVAPEAAQSIEESERFGEAARDFRLRERVEDFVEDLPERLAGGDTAEAIRSATTRGLAYFVAFILTIFLVLHGPRIAAGAVGLIEQPERRSYLTRVLRSAYERAWMYLLGTAGISMLTGLYAYIWCRIVDLPGATVLGIYVALAAIIPNVGVMVGALPLLLLSAGLEPESGWPFWLTLVFLLWQIVDVALLRRPLARRSIAVGPVVTTLVVMLGIDLYGIGGALVGFALAVFLVSVVDELAPTDEHALDLRAIPG